MRLSCLVLYSLKNQHLLLIVVNSGFGLLSFAYLLIIICFSSPLQCNQVKRNVRNRIRRNQLPIFGLIATPDIVPPAIILSAF